ncbi:MAG: hypothetical protein ACPG4T_18255 [Nannocystaceae bacterium]
MFETPSLNVNIYRCGTCHQYWGREHDTYVSCPYCQERDMNVLRADYRGALDKLKASRKRIRELLATIRGTA